MDESASVLVLVDESASGLQKQKIEKNNFPHFYIFFPFFVSREIMMPPLPLNCSINPMMCPKVLMLDLRSRPLVEVKIKK